MKKGKFLYESTMKQIDLLMPDDMKPAYTTAVEACKNVGGFYSSIKFSENVLNSIFFSEK